MKHFALTFSLGSRESVGGLGGNHYPSKTLGSFRKEEPQLRLLPPKPSGPHSRGWESLMRMIPVLPLFYQSRDNPDLLPSFLALPLRCPRSRIPFICLSFTSQLCVFPIWIKYPVSSPHTRVLRHLSPYLFRYRSVLVRTS